MGLLQEETCVFMHCLLSIELSSWGLESSIDPRDGLVGLLSGLVWVFWFWAFVLFFVFKMQLGILLVYV